MTSMVVLVCPPTVTVDEHRIPLVSAKICRVATIKRKSESIYEIDIMDAPPIRIDNKGYE